MTPERDDEFREPLLRLETAERAAFEAYMAAVRLRSPDLAERRTAWVEADRALTECRRALIIASAEGQ